MGGFLGYDSTRIDNSTRISTVSDSYNQTSSFSQGFSDIGNVKVEVPSMSAVESLQPVLILGVAVIGIVLLGGRKT